MLISFICFVDFQKTLQNYNIFLEYARVQTKSVVFQTKSVEKSADVVSAFSLFGTKGAGLTLRVCLMFGTSSMFGVEPSNQQLAAKPSPKGSNLQTRPQAGLTDD